MSVFQKILAFVALFLFSLSAQAQTASSIDMFWEANSYVPSLYQGKALPTSDGNIRVFAIPPESFGDSSRASYIWKINGTVLGSKSGTGRSSLDIVGSPFIDTNLIIVDVTGVNGTSGTGILRIPYVKPKVILYENSPLGGILFSQALQGRLLAEADKDITLLSYPYFFSTQKLNSNLSYTWEINGTTAKALGHEITARSEITGTSTVDLQVYSLTNVLQRASERVSIVLQ